MIKIEVWSDINCPFCYIGKRQLEEALKILGRPASVEWKSFELDPESRPLKGSDHTELLAKKYGRTKEWAREMNENITEMARENGLEFHMEKVVPANSFDAHRLLHLAKREGSQSALKERLLKAKFTEGKDISEFETLRACARDVGLDEKMVEKVLRGEDFGHEVRQDETMAASLGISGVPFFIFNKKWALSGARGAEVFLEVLEKISS